MTLHFSYSDFIFIGNEIKARQINRFLSSNSNTLCLTEQDLYSDYWDKIELYLNAHGATISFFLGKGNNCGQSMAFGREYNEVIDFLLSLKTNKIK